MSNQQHNKVEYIGIDQSYTSTGIVVLNQDKQLTDFTIIGSTNKGQCIQKRAYDISIDIVNWFDQRTFGYINSFCGIEQLPYQSIGNATRDLAGLQFSLYQHLYLTVFYNDNMQTVPITSHKN